MTNGLQNSNQRCFALPVNTALKRRLMCEAVTPGEYHCACCQEHSFSAAKKFNSGTGWPSFNAPVKDNVINYILDESHGMIRMEVQCAVCDAHLGHIFPDGGGDTGLRYCINGMALNKITDEQ